MHPILAFILFVGIFVVLPIVALRGMIKDRQNKSRRGTISGGLAGTMMEIDRLVRPSMEHVTEAKEVNLAPDDEIGGE